METYRKINQWSSQSRDMVESFKRYYHNSFLDGQRQEAYNLFLGNYVFAHDQPMLWDLSTDYYLHHSNPRTWSGNVKRNYIKWFNPAYFNEQKMPCATKAEGLDIETFRQHFDDYWLEYYKPLALSSFVKLFSYRMNSTLRYIPAKSLQEGQMDLSPFRPRTSHEDNSDKTRRKGVTILEPTESNESRSLFPKTADKPGTGSILKDSQMSLFTPIQETPTTAVTLKEQDKATITQVTLNHIVTNSLEPSVAPSEMEEYAHYISHPLSLPLVTSDDIIPAQNLDYTKYVEGITADEMISFQPDIDDLTEFAEYLVVEDDPLTVRDADLPKKRYKAYRQWLRGKSLFKQSRLDT
jgi:phosphatidylinositol 3,5-bisphosphate 5-phosphatase